MLKISLEIGSSLNFFTIVVRIVGPSKSIFDFNESFFIKFTPKNLNPSILTTMVDRTTGALDF